MVKGALEFDPIDHSLGSREFLASLNPMVFQDLWDFIGGSELDAGLFGGEVGPDFVGFGGGPTGFEIEIVSECGLSGEFSFHAQTGRAVVIHAVVLEMGEFVGNAFGIEGAVALFALFTGALGEEGAHEFDDLLV